MPDVPLISKIVGQGTYVLAVGAGGVVGSFSFVYRTFFTFGQKLNNASVYRNGKYKRFNEESSYLKICFDIGNKIRSKSVNAEKFEQSVTLLSVLYRTKKRGTQNLRNENSIDFFFLFSLVVSRIYTEMLSQRAIKPKTTNQITRVPFLF